MRISHFRSLLVLVLLPNELIYIRDVQNWQLEWPLKYKYLMLSNNDDDEDCIHLLYVVGKQPLSKKQCWYIFPYRYNMLFLKIMMDLSFFKKEVFSFIHTNTSFEVLLNLGIYVFIIIVHIYANLFDFTKQWFCYC